MIHGGYDPILVFLSYVIAASAGYTAFDMATHARETTRLTRAGWMTSAAVAMGGGIWSMHFVGMLAFILPIPISYDVWITLLSLILPIVVCGIGLSVVMTITPFRLVGAGLITGFGIVTMHYIGMAGMIMPAMMVYDEVWVAASVVIAIVASWLSLYLAYRIRAAWQQFIAALVFGVAVTGMHYTGMAAASFYPAPPREQIGDVFNPYLLSVAVGSTTFLILMLGLISSMLQRRMAQAARLQSEAMAEKLEILVKERTADLTTALSQKDMFVKETHHRVKNNLNVVISLLRLGERHDNPQQQRQIDEMVSRIYSVALVHEWLYRSDTVSLNLRDYLGSLLEQIENIYDVNCDCSIDGDDIELPSDGAVPIGLVCSEALTNAFKHAFAGGERRIKIMLQRLPGMIEVRIRDFGVGLPVDFESRSRGSIGIQLIRGLSKQVQGETDLYTHPDGGTVVVIRIPDSENDEAPE